MTVLAFDCSMQSCSAAILKDGRILAHHAQTMARGQAEVLLPMIGETLTGADLGWSDIDLLGVTVGPGTFTGIRIGLAAARGLALAGGLTVAGVGSCEAIAYGVPEAERRGRRLLVVIDSRRADLFAQPFDEEGRALAPPAELSLQQAAHLIDGPLLLAGDGAPLVAPLRPDAILSSVPGVPDARMVARLALERHRDGTDLPATPLYLRAPDVTLPPAGPDGSR